MLGNYHCRLALLLSFLIGFPYLLLAETRYWAGYTIDMTQFRFVQTDLTQDTLIPTVLTA